MADGSASKAPEDEWPRSFENTAGAGGSGAPSSLAAKRKDAAEPRRFAKAMVAYIYCFCLGCAAVRRALFRSGLVF